MKIQIAILRWRRIRNKPPRTAPEYKKLDSPARFEKWLMNYRGRLDRLCGGVQEKSSDR